MTNKSMSVDIFILIYSPNPRSSSFMKGHDFVSKIKNEIMLLVSIKTINQVTNS